MTSNTSHESSSWLSPVIWNILAVETAERFAYFGFRAILVLYFTIELEYDDRQAIAFFAYTTCLAYLSPILGALLADGHFGRYSVILWFGLIYVVGLSILTLGAAWSWELAFKRFLSFSGLFLVCLGTGGIKPCVSSFGADQVALRGRDTATSNANNAPKSESDGLFKRDEVPVVDPREIAPTEQTESGRAEDVRAFFGFFYFAINLGAVSSIAVVPILRGYVGFGAAFLLPTVCMVTAIILFVSHRHQYVHHKPDERSSLATTFRLCWWLFRQNLWSIPWISRTFPSWQPGALPSQHTLVQNRSEELDDNENEEDSDHTIDPILDQQLNDAAQALHVLPIMAMFPIFWCLYDQQSSVWTLQATRMELNGLQPEQLNVVNPLEIMIFIPLFDRFIYPFLQDKGVNIQPLRRMSWGMVLTAVAFFLSGVVERGIQSAELRGDKVNVFWQLPQITILAVAEIFLSITGLEFAYATSPDRLKAFLMAMYLLTTAVGDFFGGVLYSTAFTKLNLATVMDICGGLMLGNLVLFLIVARWWERREFHDLRRATSLEGLEIPDRRIV